MFEKNEQYQTCVKCTQKLSVVDTKAVDLANFNVSPSP